MPRKQKSILSAFLAPLVRGAGAAGDCGVVFLSLSLADAQQLPRQREPSKRKSVSCLAEGAKKRKANARLAEEVKRNENQFSLRSWLPLSGELAPQVTEG